MTVTFLYALAGGMLAVLATGRVEQIAWRFLRLVGAIALAIACGATAWFYARDHALYEAVQWWVRSLGAASCVAAALVVIVAPAAVRHPIGFRSITAAGGLAALCAGVVLLLVELGPRCGTVTNIVFLVLNHLLGAAVLGAITVSWLLGHAYLTATRMTIAPLRHFTHLLSWSIVLRVAFIITSLTVASLVDRGGDASVWGLLKRAWLIATLRFGVGLIAVAAFAYMVKECVRLRSTQSATGILYFASVFAYVGELASQQLVSEIGWPM